MTQSNVADTTWWGEHGTAHGRVEVAQTGVGRAARIIPLVLGTDGGYRFGNSDLPTSHEQPVAHYVAFEIGNEQLTGFSFGFDFSELTPDMLIARFGGALRDRVKQLEPLALDVDDLLTPVAATIHDVWKEHAVRQSRHADQGQDGLSLGSISVPRRRPAEPLHGPAGSDTLPRRRPTVFLIENRDVDDD